MIKIIWCWRAEQKCKKKKKKKSNKMNSLHKVWPTLPSQLPEKNIIISVLSLICFNILATHLTLSSRRISHQTISMMIKFIIANNTILSIIYGSCCVNLTRNSLQLIFDWKMSFSNMISDRHRHRLHRSHRSSHTDCLLVFIGPCAFILATMFNHFCSVICCDCRNYL